MRKTRWVRKARRLTRTLEDPRQLLPALVAREPRRKVQHPPLRQRSLDQLVDIAHLVPDRLQPARHIQVDEEPRDAVEEQVSEVGVGYTLGVDVVLHVRFGEFFEDARDGAVAFGRGGRGEGEDGGAGQGDGDAVGDERVVDLVARVLPLALELVEPRDRVRARVVEVNASVSEANAARKYAFEKVSVEPSARQAWPAKRAHPAKVEARLSIQPSASARPLSSSTRAKEYAQHLPLGLPVALVLSDAR